MPTQKESNLPGISRIDHRHTHGWFVRVYLKDRKILSKLFSDRKYGGQKEALARAKKWRDINYPPPELQPRPHRYLKKPPVHNSTGRVGVSKTFTRGRGGKGSKIWCYNVSWVPEPNHPKSKSFYINKYPSEEEAFQAACDFRAQKERELDQQEAARPPKTEKPRRRTKLNKYFAACPPHRQERLFRIHALILDNFPDVDVSIENKMPTYKNGPNWTALANQKHYISVYTCSRYIIADFIAKHPDIKCGTACLNFTDNTEIPYSDLEVVIRKALTAAKEQKKSK